MPDDPAKIDCQSAQIQLMRMATAYGISRLLNVAVELGLPDRLADGPKTAEDLAGPTRTHGPSLYRAMRAMAHLGLLSEDSAHRFSLTPLSEPLKTGAPGSIRNSVLTLTGELMTRPMDNLLYSVQTGKPGFDKAFGMPFFDWLEGHPEQGSLFSETMVGYHGPEHAAVAAAYDFSGLETIVDVGGATGNFLSTILAAHPAPRGILFDTEHVVRDAPLLIQSRGLEHRIRIETGSFFDHVPQGGDAYLLSHVLHDWTEAQCLTILGNCRRAMKPASRLLITELVLPEGDARHPGKRLDVMMLVLTEGQERSEREYRELLEKAGFRLSRVIPTQSAASVVEAFPVVAAQL